VKNEMQVYFSSVTFRGQNNEISMLAAEVMDYSYQTQKARNEHGFAPKTRFIFIPTISAKLSRNSKSGIKISFII
jgi:hypothetical protein